MCPGAWDTVMEALEKQSLDRHRIFRKNLTSYRGLKEDLNRSVPRKANTLSCKQIHNQGLTTDSKELPGNIVLPLYKVLQFSIKDIW